MAKKSKAQAKPEKILMTERKRLKLFGLPFTFTTYTVTEKKLIVKTGFFNIEEDEVLLFRIKDLSIKRPLSLRIWGMGCIDVVSADSTLKNFTIKNIKNVREFYNLLSERMEEERVRLRYRPGEILEGSDDSHDDDFSLDYDGLN